MTQNADAPIYLRLWNLIKKHVEILIAGEQLIKKASNSCKDENSHKRLE